MNLLAQFISWLLWESEVNWFARALFRLIWFGCLPFLLLRLAYRVTVLNDVSFAAVED